MGLLKDFLPEEIAFYLVQMPKVMTKSLLPNANQNLVKGKIYKTFVYVTCK